MIAFIGVRISWLMFARNIDFSSVASSALSRAASSSFVCSSSCFACCWVRPRSSCVLRLRSRISRLMAATGRSSSRSAVSFGARSRKEASSSDGAELALRDQRPRSRRGGRRLADPGRDAQVSRRKPRQRRGTAVGGALAGEPLPEAQRLRASLREAVTGHAAQRARVARYGVQRADPSTESGDEPGEKPAAELGDGGRALEVAGQPRGMRLDPALLLHRRRAGLQHVDRAGEVGRLVGASRVRHRLRVVAARDRLDARPQVAQRMDDPTEGDVAEGAREGEREHEGDQRLAPRAGDVVLEGPARAHGQLLVVSDPLLRRVAEPRSENAEGSVQRRGRLATGGPRRSGP